MIPVAKGMNVITPIYSRTGKSSTTMAIISSIEVHKRAIRDTIIRQKWPETKRSMRVAQFKINPIVIIFDVPQAEHGQPDYPSSKRVFTCKNSGTILIQRAFSKFSIQRSTANCLTIKNAHKIPRGIIEVLIFLITTNLINIPATNIAIKSLINHASFKITISKIIIREDDRNAIPQIRANLSEQQETMSAKNTNINKKEKAMTIQYAQSAESGIKVLRYTLAKRKIGQMIANKQPNLIGLILLYLILLQRTIRIIKAKHCVIIRASFGRYIPQLYSFCQFLSTKYTNHFYPLSFAHQRLLVYSIQIASVISVTSPKLTFYTSMVSYLFDYSITGEQIF